MARNAKVSRKTNETDISLQFSLDGSGVCQINTGIGFFDHMLELFARHGLFDLTVQAAGDLHVDGHHTVEDTGIVLGQAIGQAAGDKCSICRYGTSHVPMDEALAMVSLDVSGRPYLVFDAAFPAARTGELDTELVQEFFRAVAFQAGLTLHVHVMYGTNTHHMIEAIFKAFARALDAATRLDDRIQGVMSTKGVL